MTTAFAFPVTADTSDLYEPGIVAQTASRIRSVVGVLTRGAGQIDHFASPAPAEADAATTGAIFVRLTASTAKQEPTDVQLSAAGLAFVAEFEHEFGPIPDEVISEIYRKWPR